MHICLGVVVAAAFGLDAASQAPPLPTAGCDECAIALTGVAAHGHDAPIAKAVAPGGGESIRTSYIVVDRTGVDEARPLWGSLYTMPEPAMIVFLAIGGVSFLLRRR